MLSGIRTVDVALESHVAASESKKLFLIETVKVRLSLEVNRFWVLVSSFLQNLRYGFYKVV